MAHVVKDRVQETTSSTGTGTITLGGAATGFQSFSVIGNGNTTYYTIVGGTEWEVGIGTYTASGTTLSRNTVLESSNGGSLVNFSAGTKNVFVTYPAEESVDQDTTQTLTNKTLTSPTLTSPVLGTPSSGTLTNCTGYTYANLSGTVPTWNQNTTGNAATATTATNQSGGTVSATTGSFSGQVSVPQSASVGANGINLNAAGNGFLRGTANDTASSTQANVQLMSWNGIGFSPSIGGQAVPSGENAVWIDARSGAISARNNVTAYASDERLKENFTPIDNALNKVKSISGYTFDWDIELCRSLGFAPTQKHEHGVKAQEIQKVLPDAVCIAPFDADRDENGNTISRSGNDYLTVRYERLIPLLIEAIKELKAEVDALKVK